MKTTRNRLFARLLCAGAVALCTFSGLNAADLAAVRGARALPSGLKSLRLADPDSARPVLDASLADAQGRVQLIVRLRTAAVGAGTGSTAAQIHAEQAAFIGRLTGMAPTARVIASVQLVLNAVFVEIDAVDLPALAADTGVSRVAPVGNYQIALFDTVPYIGAETLQGLDTTGDGVRVAVLDSGIDYTHADLGGSGDPADFAANDPNVLAPGDGFPNAKVIGGFDFTGGLWPNTPGGVTQPDADPLDKSPGDVDASGHGTHVASIIAGVDGVAPDASLYAVKVCSSVSTSCSGVALIEGMDFAVDPDGDDDPSDHVDIINMSLGSLFGQPFDDDLSAAVDAATRLGVLTVASAGNSADRQFITGSPAAAVTALSVAQTAVPSEELQFMEVVTPALGEFGAVFQAWSMSLTAQIQESLRYDTATQFTRLGCSNAAGASPWTGQPLAGHIVLVDRGLCAASMKISNIAAAGGKVGVIGFVDASVPFSFAFGGGNPNIPGYAISLADANAIKAALGGVVTAKFDPDNQLALVGSIVSTSSRGPQYEDKRIKPEIGAPGASVSAEHGTGTGRTPFGGTSGAAPMVSGSAALLLEFYRDHGEHDGPNRVKQALITTADTGTIAPTEPGALVPNALAPITRIGGGEVRVDRAALATASVNPKDRRGNRSGGLSFGYVDVSRSVVRISKEIRISNHLDEPQAFWITPSLRFANDAANGAISIALPGWVYLGPKDSKDLRVTLRIDGEKLRDNLMNSGNRGADPRPLTANEYDGFITFSNPEQTLTLPWHVLPRKAADVEKRSGGKLKFGADGSGVIRLRNRGVGTANLDAYALMALSGNLPEGGRGEGNPTPDIRAVGVNTFPVGADFCSDEPSFVWAFAFHNWERDTMPAFYRHQVLLDVDRNGVFDWIVFNALATSGQVVTFAQAFNPASDGGSGAATAFFFTEHATTSTNTVLYICAEQVGLSGADLLTRSVDARFRTRDFYFGGAGDETGTVTLVPFGERFVAFGADIPGRSKGSLDVFDFGEPGLPKSPDLGLLVLTNGDRCSGSPITSGNCGGSTFASEALRFMARKGQNGSDKDDDEENGKDDGDDGDGDGDGDEGDD